MEKDKSCQILGFPLWNVPGECGDPLCHTLSFDVVWQPALIGAFTRDFGEPRAPDGFGPENVGYIPNEIAIFHRDNDQQNHWVEGYTIFRQTQMAMLRHDTCGNNNMTRVFFKECLRCFKHLFKDVSRHKGSIRI